MVTIGSATTRATTASAGRIAARARKPRAYKTSAATAIARDRLAMASHSPAQVAASAATASVTTRSCLVSRDRGAESSTETGPVSDDTSESARATPARSLTPVLEQIAERLLERDAWLPAQRVQPAAITDQHRDVRRPEAGRVLTERDGLVGGLTEQKIEDLLDRPPTAGAEVVDLPGLASIEEQPVAVNDVAHVGVVADRLEIADEDRRLPLSRFDLRDLLGEVRLHEHAAAPRSRIVDDVATQAGVEDMVLRLEVPDFTLVGDGLDLLNHVLGDFQMTSPALVRLDTGVEVDQIVGPALTNLGVEA